MLQSTGDGDGAQRIWTKYLSEDVSVGEFDDGDIIINYELRTEPASAILLKPNQACNLIEFTRSDDRAAAGEVSLGEVPTGWEVTIQYEDGSYHLSRGPEEVEVSGTLMTQIVLLLEPPRGILD